MSVAEGWTNNTGHGKRRKSHFPCCPASRRVWLKTSHCVWTELPHASWTGHARWNNSEMIKAGKTMRGWKSHWRRTKLMEGAGTAGEVKDRIQTRI